MKTSKKPVEERLANLETELERLKNQICENGKSGWRAIVGGHEGSLFFQDVVREIRRNRREDYAEARRER